MVQECVTCHTTTSFRDVDGEAVHARTAFPLTGAHAQVTCETCHLTDRGGAFTALDTDCVSCHLSGYEHATTVDHVASGYPTDCTQCHSTLAWADTPSFDHAGVSAGFELIGAHVDLRCASCHVMPGLAPLWSASDQDDCVGCHQDDYDRRHTGSSFPATCLSCHTVESWEVRDFDHAVTGFSLVGSHSALECSSCHSGPNGSLGWPAPAGQDDCASCHRTDYDREHDRSGFPMTCLSCHNVDRWSGAGFDHSSTGFALLGAHAQATCADCHGAPAHLSQLFTGPEDCVACHQTDYDGEHSGSGFPTTCLTCHGVSDWDETTFDHQTTAFPLIGAHAESGCADCHGPPAHLSQGFAGADGCVACHQTEYDDNHAGSTLPVTCLECHNQTSWRGTTFDHPTYGNGFVLEGPHATVACGSCHTVPSYELRFPLPAAPDDCVSCHQADYDTNHAGSGIPTTCLSCHAADRWEDASFDHTGLTGFTLDETHATAACQSCHTVPDYALKFPKPNAPDDCVSCHQADYEANHSGSDFPTACLTCHVPGRWDGASFDHGQVTGFTLDETHATAACESCHTLPDYGLKFAKPANAQDCVSCHQADYDTNHGGTNFPTTCLSCHVPGRWDGASFDHGVTTGFSLLGPHAPLECTACHGVPGYVLLFPPPATQDDCVACHQAAYDANHAGSGFPTTCLTCHVPDRWDGATVDHATLGNGFDLLGAHAVAPCASCHGIPGYALLFPPPAGPNDCLACHQTDFASAHSGSGYPTDCAACHTVSGWKPSTFDHDAQYFPIFSGKHRGEWRDCTECHTVPSDLSVFTCLTCHKKKEMDDKHKEENGYAYNSANCLSCHPRGRAD
jgi:hypothetical protein